MEIVLEDLKREDLAVIRDWIDPRIFRIFEAPVDEAQLEVLLSRKEGDLREDVGLRAVDGGTGGLLGFLHAVIDRRNDLAHVQQIVVRPDRRGNGIGTSMLRSFLEICFEEHALHRVQIFADEDNEPALACYGRAGFHREGLIRESVRTDEGYVSWYSLSVLEPEWRGREEHEG
jgi:RimJ/RimL family protein N-acetyltransferase